MKILCFTDNHFCERASIISRYGTKYSMRLENQLESLNWVEKLATDNKCEMVICLGDFFDKPHLTDQELTALQEIKWNENIPHYFIVGNHESEESSLQYNSTNALKATSRIIIETPQLLEFTNFEIAFLPYITERDRKALPEYFGNLTSKPRMLFSHNDLSGIQMGPVISRTGFDPEEIKQNCIFCINGHLHNGQPVNNKVLNLGNLTGKDFGEDSTRYSHKVLIIDTDNFTVTPYENPHAFNFYKIEINSKTDLNKLKGLKSNAVVSLKCNELLIEQAREAVKNISNIIESRIILSKDYTTGTVAEGDIGDLTVDQCAKFAECCREKLENSDILEAELAEILK